MHGLYKDRDFLFFFFFFKVASGKKIGLKNSSGYLRIIRSSVFSLSLFLNNNYLIHYICFKETQVTNPMYIS